MTDDEWAFFEPFLIRRGGRPPGNHRRVLDAVFWLMRTGAPWRDLPEEFGNWNSIFRQFRRWAALTDVAWKKSGKPVQRKRDCYPTFRRGSGGGVMRPDERSF